MHSHAERGHDHKIDGACTGLFPAKAGPTKSRPRTPVAPALAGKPSPLPVPLIFIHKKLRHRQSRLGCRLNAGLAPWAERHGCRESRPPPWMADGGGPTERDRSEGTLRNEGPNQEQAPLVTWGAFPSNSPKAKQSAPRQTLLILNLILIVASRPAGLADTIQWNF